MSMNLKPQDVVVALKLCAYPDARPAMSVIANDLSLSPSEVHGAIRRLRASRLLHGPNLKDRPKLLIHQNFSLRIETEVEQLRFVLDGVQRMLNEHPAIEAGTSRLRVIDFAGAAFELELFAYAKTGNWADFTAIRQAVILKIAEIVKAAGTRFAAPTQLTYLARDAGVDTEKANDVVRHVTDLRANDAFSIPGETGP